MKRSSLIGILRGAAFATALATAVLVAQAADAPKKKGKAKDAAPANPAAAAMAKFDTDKNELLDSKERPALREAFAKDASLKPLDANGDGLLDNGEINRIEDPPRQKNAKKKAAATK